VRLLLRVTLGNVFVPTLSTHVTVVVGSVRKKAMSSTRHFQPDPAAAANAVPSPEVARVARISV
jgi:hypothetical protein